MVINNQNMSPNLNPELLNLNEEDRNIIGKVFWLFNFSNVHKQYTAEMILRRVLPSLINNQYLYCEQNGYPIGFCNWAFLDDETLASTTNPRYTLKWDEWKNGDNLFFPELIAPFGHCRQIVAKLKEIFKGKTGVGLHVKMNSKGLERRFKSSFYHAKEFN